MFETSDNNFISIPKDFVSGVRIGNGPMEGVIAKPCLCGTPCVEGDECILIGTNFGDFYLVHVEHAPAGIFGAGGLDAEL